jgi:hypothetical protein
MTKQNETDATDKARLPKYETPRIQAMNEKDILNSFQISQSMAGWWVVPTC